MGLPYLNHFIPQGLLVGLNIQPPFLKFPPLPLVMDMVANISTLHTLLIWGLLDLFTRYQVFHQKTLLISVIILEIHYFVLFSDVDIEFP